MRETFLTSARLLPVEAVFFTAGLLTLWRLPVKATPRFRAFLYLGLAISLVPAFVTNQNPHSLRAGAFAILAPLVSAGGALALRDWFISRGIKRSVLGAAFSVSLILSFGVVAYMYLGSPNPRRQRMQAGLVEASKLLAHYQVGHPRVIVELVDIQPYLYVVAFSGMTPREFQLAPKELVEKDSWDVVRQVGKYFFRTAAELRGQSCNPAAGSGSDLVVSRQRLPGLPVDSAGPDSERYYFFQTQSGCYR